MKHAIQLLAGLLFLCSLLSCSGSGIPPQTWTIMVYLDGDNNLSEAALADLDELKNATASPYVTIIVQLDLPGGVTTKRFLINNHQLEQIADLGELDMSAETTITDFLTWGASAYPSERTVLLLWDHGNGWDQGASVSAAKTTSKTVSSMFTDTDNNGASAKFLANYRIRNAIKASGIRLDVLAFDGCSMGTLEALYEFRGLADILISSEELTSVTGWDYKGLVSGLAAQPEMPVEDFGRLAVSSYRNFYENVYYPFTGAERSNTISALRSNVLQEIAEGVNALAVGLEQRLDDQLTRGDTVSLLAQARLNVQEIDKYAEAFVYVDLLDLAKRLDPGSTLLASITKAVIDEYHGSARPGANGIAIVFFRLPDAKTYNTFDANYANFNPAIQSGNKGEFIMSYRWDELLAKYYLYAGL
jgi:hypothetical protein